MRQRVAITGGSGFIGTNLVRRYQDAGDAVLALDCSPPADPGQRGNWHEVDLLERDKLAHALREFDPTVVFHLAARTDLDGRTVADYGANTTGVENLIRAIRDLPSLQRAIFASSQLVCRMGYQPRAEDDYCPTTPYGESKMIGERIVREANLAVPWAIVRPTAIWGPWGEVPFRSFFQAIARGRYLHVRGRDPRKSYGFVGNSVAQLQALGSAPADALRGQTLYLADDPPIRLGEMAEGIRRELNAPRIRTVPLSVLRIAARAGDQVERLSRRKAPLTTFRLDNMLTEIVQDVSPLTEITGPARYSLDQGIAMTVRHMREQGHL